ncbi:TPA: GBS Bsp-like repeat-containing protein [Streptococcus suis]|nr:GBS Bsp-like repeat-containing protein [Streptococcus suis]
MSNKKNFPYKPKPYLAIPIVLALFSNLQAHAEEIATVSQTSVETSEFPTITESTSTTTTTITTTAPTTSDSKQNLSSQSLTESITNNSETDEQVESLNQLTNASGASFRSASSNNATETSTPVQTTISRSEDTSLSIKETTNTLPVITVTQENQQLLVQYNYQMKQTESISVAVWSDLKQQDDLQWYPLDKAGTAHIDLYKHTEYGKYHIHTYANRNGQMVGLAADTITTAPPKLSHTITQTSDTSVEVIISGLPNTFKTVRVPIWSDAKGQDELKWYETSKQTDGSFKAVLDIKHHNYETGLYHIHAYGVLKNDQLAALFATNYTLPSPKIDHKLTQTSNTSVDILISGVPQYFKAVRVPIWSNANGQDEIKWYEATRLTGGQFKATLDIKNHNFETGLYHIHAYGVLQNDKLAGLFATNYTLPSPKIEHTITQTSNTSVDILISGVPQYFKAVRVPIWSNVNGQDEIKWYEATRLTGGQFKATLDIKNHNFETGLYHIHAYGVLQNDKLAGLFATNYTLPSPKIEHTITQTSNTSVDVLISGVPQYFKAVRVPMWSNANGQDEIKWYDATRLTGGQFKATLDIKNHNFETGFYHIHAYGVLPNNHLTALFATHHTLPSPQKLSGHLQVETTNQQTGNFSVRISNISSPTGVKEVKVPIWSNAHGQDDIVWYTGQKQADGSYIVTVSAANHKYSSGLYHIHLYYQDTLGKLHFVSNTGHEVTYKGPKYNGQFHSIQGKYDEIIIVNKKHPLSPSYAPGENTTAKQAFLAMTNRMRVLGYPISNSYSGYRSYNHQAGLYQNYVLRDGRAAADRYAARPGYSEHQTGLAFDIFSNQGLSLNPATVNWIANHAHEYGFIVRYLPGKEHITGYMHEPWHLRYIGREATDIYHSGLTLEEYFGIIGGGYN